MNKVGFPIPQKENERRRALLPPHLASVTHRDELVFENGYGEVMGYGDEAYERLGAVVADTAAVCACPIICNSKPSVTDEYFQPGKTIFGWIHAVQGRRITDAMVEKQMTAIAWEDMFEGGRHIFWRNNELSGEAAVMHALLQWGRVANECRAALIGRGNVARGACRALERLGCAVMVYDRKTVHLLRDEIGQYDIIVNAVSWDVFRTDHLVYEEDMAKMKPGSLIIDVSCDEAMGVETSRPTTIADPVYWHGGVLHYAVDHTPALLFRTASESISSTVSRFIDALVLGRDDPVLETATVVRKGKILDEKIIRFQNRS